MTVADLIAYAFARIGVLQPGESVQPADQADAFAILQDLQASWQTERLTIPFIRRTTWTITANSGSTTAPITVGSGGTVNILRPTFVDHLNFRDTTQTSPQEIPLTTLTEDAY